jgi:hypothetical protein
MHQTQHDDLRNKIAASNEPFDPLAEIYRFKGHRIGDPCLGVGCIALGLFIWITFDGKDILAVFFAVLGLANLWISLRSPYELWIASSGLLRFINVTGRTDLRAADIVRLVRCENESDGKLREIRVEHGAGSITLPGREEVFAGLAKLIPTEQVSKEKHDDIFYD